MCIRNKNTVIIYMAVLEFNLYVFFFSFSHWVSCPFLKRNACSLKLMTSLSKTNCLPIIWVNHQTLESQEQHPKERDNQTSNSTIMQES